MDAALRARVDASDVIQETQIGDHSAHRRLRAHASDFVSPLAQADGPRTVDCRQDGDTCELQSDQRIETFRCRMRLRWPLHANLISSSPSKAMQREELARQVRAAIIELNELDREVLLLRHVEELTNAEIAKLLNIQPAAARKRHGRAFRRLCQQLVELGFSPGSFQ